MKRMLEDYGSKLDLRHVDQRPLFKTKEHDEALAYAIAHEAMPREVVAATDGVATFFVVGRLVDNGAWDLLSRMGEWIRIEFRGYYEPPSGDRW